MSGLFNPKKPQPTPAAPMPDSGSPAVLEAQRKAAADAVARAGRASTILTAPADRSSPTNADSYAANKLGGQ